MNNINIYIFYIKVDAIKLHFAGVIVLLKYVCNEGFEEHAIESNLYAKFCNAVVNCDL